MPQKTLHKVGDIVMAFDAGHRMDPNSWESLGDQKPNNRQFYRKAVVIARRPNPEWIDGDASDCFNRNVDPVVYDLAWIDAKPVAEGLDPEACAISYGHFDPMTVEEWEEKFLATHEVRVAKHELERMGSGSLIGKLKGFILVNNLHDGDKIRILFEQYSTEQKRKNGGPDTRIVYEFVPMCLCNDMVWLCERFKVEVSEYTNQNVL